MRRKILRTVFLSAVLCAVLPLSAAFAETATVNASDVNVRSGPGTEYEIIDCLARDTEVTVTDRSNGSWYAVSFDGQDGFMSSRYLTIAEEEAPELEQPEENTGSGSTNGSVNAMYVNFRSSPSTENSSVLGQYNKGKAVLIEGYVGDWVKLTIDGRSGYMFRSYVSADGSAPEAPAAAATTPATTGGGEDGSATYNFDGEPEQTPAPTPAPTPTPSPAPKSEEQQPQEQPQTEPEQPKTETPGGIANSFKGHITGDYVRFRTGPSTNHSIINSYNKNTVLYAVAQDGDWVRAYIDGVEGYVFAQYVYIDDTPEVAAAPEQPAPQPQPQTEPEAQPEPEKPQVNETEETEGYISGNDVRFRSGPSMTSDIIGTFYFGNSVTITGTTDDGWTAVIYDGRPGFVYSQYVKQGSFSVGGGGDGDTAEYSGTGAEIAQFALSFKGSPYCWGGASPETGFDCSGLVYYTYKHFGYTLNRVAADQANNGYAVDHSALQPGDILCFYSGGGYIGHAGIYIGNDMFVHACNSSTGVIVSQLSGYYAERGYEARRIVG